VVDVLAVVMAQDTCRLSCQRQLQQQHTTLPTMGSSSSSSWGSVSRYLTRLAGYNMEAWATIIQVRQQSSSVQLGPARSSSGCCQQHDAGCCTSALTNTVNA
jgi:hypothetical protein